MKAWPLQGSQAQVFKDELQCLYRYRKVHLESLNDAKSFTSRLYPVLQHHEQVFKDEL